MKSIEQPPSLERPIAVEDARPEDAAAIAHVRNVTWQATYPNKKAGITLEDILSKDFESETEVGKWRKAIEKKEGPRRLWVARESEGVVGYSQGRKGENFNEILGLYVLPEYQGKGLGRGLMSRAMEWLGDEKPVLLSAASYSLSAIELYKKFGFEITGEDENSGPDFASGAKIPSVRMMKVAAK